MITINRNQINPIKMCTNPLKEIINCGMRVINSDGFIYQYIGVGWVKENKAEQKDYLEIPQLID